MPNDPAPFIRPETPHQSPSIAMDVPKSESGLGATSSASWIAMTWHGLDWARPGRDESRARQASAMGCRMGELLLGFATRAEDTGR